MATTTNYSWTTPDDTALVKDGAAAIRSLGSSIDTTTKNLNPSTTLGDIEYRSSTANVNTRLPIGTAGQVLKVNSGGTAPEWATDATGMSNPMTTTGDTIYSSSGSTPARLAIGSTGNVLTVAGGVPTWAAPAAPSVNANWVLLNSGGTTLSGATTITVSGISNRNQLFIFINSGGVTNSSATISLQLNGDTGNNYRSFGFYVLRGDANNVAQVNLNQDNMPIYTLENGNQNGAAGILISGCNSTGQKVVDIKGGGSSTSNDRSYNTYGLYDSSSTISSISLVSNNGNFDQGTVFVYGSTN